jgi:uncharacterized membrane protein YhaH (DUF805 family)
MNWKSYFSLQGRLRRKHYLPIHLTAFAIMLTLGMIEVKTGLKMGFFSYLVIFAMIPPSVKRLHDMGYTGWFYLGVIAIPYASLLLLCIPGDGGTEYGPDPRSPAPASPPPVPTA